MRKLWICILVVLCVTVGVSAAQSVVLEDVGISLTLPEEFDSMYIGMAEDAFLPDVFGLTYEDAMVYMEENSTLLYAVNSDKRHAIQMTMYESDLVDMQYMSDILLKSYGLLLTAEDKLLDGSQAASMIYWYDDSIFIQSHYEHYDNEGALVYADVFHTIFRGNSINLTLYRFGNPIDQQQTEDFAVMIEGMEFSKPPLKPQPEKQIAGYRYAHEKSGAEFDVPPNWESGPRESDLSMDSFVMSATDGTNLQLYYFVMDFYEGFDGELQAMFDRSEINMDFITEEDIREIAQKWGNVISVSEKQLRNHPFILVEMETDYPLDEDTIGISATGAIYVDNGYIHMFLIYDSQDSYSYPAFEKLLNSFEVPKAAVPAEEKMEPAAETAAETKHPEAEKTSESKPVSASRIKRAVKYLYVLIVAAIGWIVKTIRKKRGLADQTPRPEEIRMGYVCPRCGKEVAAGESFCGNCGKALKPMEETEKTVQYACPKCGRNIKTGLRFCPGCGTLLNWDKE